MTQGDFGRFAIVDVGEDQRPAGDLETPEEESSAVVFFGGEGHGKQYDSS